MGRAPKSVAILGSGAMPETGIFITEWAKKNNKRIQIHSLEISAERLEKSQKVYDILCGSSEHLTFEVGDIKTAPQDLGAYEVVYFNAAVGATTTEKEDLIINVVKRMKPGAFVLSRTTHSLKTMAYPVNFVQSLFLCCTCIGNILTNNKAGSDTDPPHCQKTKTCFNRPNEW